MIQIWNTDFVAEHTACMARSLKHWTGRDLFKEIPSATDFAKAVFDAPFVLVSHGTQSDPILNYGNAAALKLWEMTWNELTQTPSRLTAEAPNRAERARLLEQVTKHGFIDNYSGIRISKNGHRFKIHQATVWNLISEKGEPRGQAATFSHWDFLKE